jgi:hypothetical protein
MPTYFLLLSLLLAAVTAVAGYLAGSARANDRFAALARDLGAE